MSLSNSLRAFLTVEWLHCSGGRSSSLGQLWRERERGDTREEKRDEGGGGGRQGCGGRERGESMRNNSDGEETKIERKASSPDGIFSEVIKYTSYRFCNTISGWFYRIRRVGHSSDVRSAGVITPIWKSGNTCEPSNWGVMCVRGGEVLLQQTDTNDNVIHNQTMYKSIKWFIFSFLYFIFSIGSINHLVLHDMDIF